jgi:hypothetical protein
MRPQSPRPTRSSCFHVLFLATRLRSMQCILWRDRRTVLIRVHLYVRPPSRVLVRSSLSEMPSCRIPGVFYSPYVRVGTIPVYLRFAGMSTVYTVYCTQSNPVIRSYTHTLWVMVHLKMYQRYCSTAVKYGPY